MMQLKILNKNFLIILAVDALLLIGAFYAAHLVRFDFQIPTETWVAFKRTLPFVLLIKVVIFYFFDVYRGMWRYTSIADLMNIIKASSVSTLVIVSLILFHTRFIGFARSVFVIDYCLTILFISAFRLGIRIYFVHFGEKTSLSESVNIGLNLFTKSFHDRKKLLIIGAGDCAEKIYREIRDNARLKYKVVGFIDDDLHKIGLKIHGIPVFGQIINISSVSRKVQADELLIAIPSVKSTQMRKIVELCKESGIKFKTIPGMGELIDGRVTVNAIREVDIGDLLGREIINLDEEGIGSSINGQNILVTGAGGSIGSELCRQICRFKPKRIVLYEIAESPLYEIELELKKKYDEVTIVPLLADIRDKNQLKKAFIAYTPQVVFHAAAYKHVPMLEIQPWKAIENNICGTLNLIEITNEFNIERFVFVSTDKAVRPSNIMGASKRVSEMLVQNQNFSGLSKTKYMIVRFGNVLGSVGSVVPLFKKQIQKGGPITVTHSEATRYFMTIPEACQLILQAGVMGKGGEIFLLDMGTAIKIDDLAKDLIRLSGFEPDVDIKVEYVGLRPGEKLFEELIVEGENIVSTSHGKIMVLEGVQCDLSFLNGKINELKELAKDQDNEKIKEKLKEVVPEYIPA